jgi:hypothetical protein
MRSPRRIAMLVLVFALLGAATTVAVAWGIAVRGVDPHGRRNKIDMTPIALADMNGSNVFICWPTISGPGWTWTATFLVPRNSISDDGKSVRPFGHTHGDHVGLVIERTGAFPRDRQLPFENNLYTEVRLGWPSVCMWAIERGNGRLDFMMSIEWSPVMYLRQDKIGQAKPFIRDEGSSRPPRGYRRAPRHPLTRVRDQHCFLRGRVVDAHLRPYARTRVESTPSRPVREVHIRPAWA